MKINCTISNLFIENKFSLFVYSTVLINIQVKNKCVGERIDIPYLSKNIKCIFGHIYQKQIHMYKI